MRRAPCGAVVAVLLSAPGAWSAEPLRGPFPPAPPAAGPARDCPPPPEPVRAIEGVSFYADPAFSRPDPARLAADRAVQARLDRFLDAVQGPADRHREGMAGAAACALATLDSWAKDGALLGAVNQQGGYHRVWALAGAALAFLKVRDAPGLDPVALGRVGLWLRRVAEAARPRYDRPSAAAISDTRNNHAAWAGLAVAAAGIAGNDRVLFDWGMERLRAQLAQVTGQGALPQELARGALALHYHLFALQAVAVLERLAAANGVALPAAEAAALDRLTRFALAGAQEPETVAALAGVAQDDPWLGGRPPLRSGAGLEIRAQAAPDPSLEAALAPFRPYAVRWLGGRVSGAWGAAAPPAAAGPAAAPPPPAR
ncbi:alginate lyase family protein [Roseomonas sp. OT10]|uniref:alginate lyase family protein n=1 Tax=Roseomonas cutis TaxID=2897332 RepID=UPI001E5B43CE|nr:alginate lyase family protein [Roseomonas sp. OT10]UFN50403.1 alginate lyase family protein [Roseomonas sp. OT10]